MSRGRKEVFTGRQGRKGIPGKGDGLSQGPETEDGTRRSKGGSCCSQKMTIKSSSGYMFSQPKTERERLRWRLLKHCK